MRERDLAHAIEIIPDRLSWAAVHKKPKDTSELLYFSTDKKFVYEPIYDDFGPLDLAKIARYCTMLDAMLKDPALSDKTIMHCCSHDPEKRANAALLICAYQVIVLRRTAEMAYQPFRETGPPFAPFRNAPHEICTFHLTIVDCLRGLEESIEKGWFNWEHFDADGYEFFQRRENGNMSWIIPGKLLAFPEPGTAPVDAHGFPTLTPEVYVQHLQEANIGLVIRLNKKHYDRQRFINHGIRHVDCQLPVGAGPCSDAIFKALRIVHAEPGAVAVHCKAGLGRAGTLAGLYAMAQHRLPARAAMAWCRMCRPGSIVGRQQHFLLDMQSDLFQDGAVRRGPPRVPCSPDGGHAPALQIEARRLPESSRAEDEDAGHCERQ